MTVSPHGAQEIDAAGIALPPWRDPGLPLEQRVDALLEELTLQEKVAQLGSAWVGSDEISGNVGPMQEVFAAGRVPLAEQARYGLGQLTRVFGTKPIHPRDGVRRLVALQQEVFEQSRLGIPAIVHEECLTGFTTLGATVYPTALAWAATFDPDLVYRMSAAIGEDLRAVGVHQGLAPVLDVVRDYRWGRVEETLGEDPYLVATLGTAYVQGLQSAGIAATLKHFAGYSSSRAARNHAPVSMGPRELRDVVLPPFELAIRDGGARAVMNSYADVDGIPAGADAHLLTGILRQEWDFTGVVVSDYWSIAFLHTMHAIAPDLARAGAKALAAGIDVELPDTLCYGDHLVEQVRSGTLDETLVDRAARRVLRQKVELGLLDPHWAPEADASAGTDVELDSPPHRALAREVAGRSVVLLANDAILPLSPSPRKIALVGPGADDARVFMGCYSYPNHVLPRYPELGLGIAAPTLRDSVQQEFPDAVILTARGCGITGDDTSGFTAAADVAARADVCIAVVGDRAGLFGRGTSGEGCDAPDLSLPGVQSRMLATLLDTGTPLVIVVVSGRPYALGEYAERAAAMIQAFMPGEEGGAAIAGAISGRINPSGRLPVQIPRIPGAQPSTYLQPPLGGHTNGISNLDPRPLFPFGHGLSYTRFDYSDLTLSTEEIDSDGTLEVAVTVTNTGGRGGIDTVQLYLEDVEAEVVRPRRQLLGYTPVALAPGQQARVTFTVHADRTGFTGIDLHRIVEPGTFRLLVAASATDVRDHAAFAIRGSVRQIGHGRVMTTPVHVTLAEPGECPTPHSLPDGRRSQP